MAQTNFSGKLLNPVSSSRTGGVIPSDNVIRSIASWADALEPRRTPILTRCGKGKAVDQVKTEWGQSYHTPVSGELNDSGGINTTVTTITLASGQSKFIQPWHVIEIVEWADTGKTRLDYSTREEVIVESINTSTDVITVKRGNGSGTGVSHAADAYWAVCGVAMPYNTDFQMSPFTRGDLLYNFPQRFYGMVGADVAARNTPTYETSSDQMLRDLEETTMLQKFYLERTIVSGQRLEGDAASTTTGGTTSVPYKMGGIDYYITNHSGRVNNLGGRTLSAYDLEDVLRDMYKEVDDGGAKTLVMGVDTAAIFDTLLNPIRQATVTDTSVNLVVDTLKFRWGTLEIMPTQHMPEGSILFVDFKDIKVHPYKGVAWSTRSVATDGPYDRMAVFGDYTLTLNRPARMGKIHNFSTDLNNYPRKEFF